jgi:hypothetical protein
MLALLFRELIEIAQIADQRRLTIWYAQFQQEYPLADALLQNCAQLEPDKVWSYLLSEFPVLSLLTKMQLITETELLRTIHFLHNYAKEKNHDSKTL